MIDNDLAKEIILHTSCCHHFSQEISNFLLDWNKDQNCNLILNLLFFLFLLRFFKVSRIASSLILAKLVTLCFFKMTVV